MRRLDSLQTSGGLGEHCSSSAVGHVLCAPLGRVAQPRLFANYRGNPAGAANRGRLLWVTFLGKTRKVTCCRATPGKLSTPASAMLGCPLSLVSTDKNNAPALSTIRFSIYGVFTAYYTLRLPNTMPDSDLIAYAAALVALLSALYARHTRDAARRANDIAVQNGLRPFRLEVYRSMQDFAQYCSTYRTLWHIGAVKGTRDLVGRIESFKWEIEQQGPLAMPAIETKVTEFQNKAWQMQRLLDRLAAGQNNPEDHAYQSGEENMDGLVEWFADERKKLRTTFQTYLGEA